MTTSMSDNTLARIKELLAKAPTEPWSFIDFDNSDLVVELRNNAEALISRLEAAEARAAAAEVERDSLRIALDWIAEGKHATVSAFAKEAVARARAALTANPKDTEDEHQP